ncbi:phage tail tape measure protein [Christiangramia sp.]|uniref:phage tail tape measure protein n=1 Tax=Christiangramia sp. TaxID=1931228 RepID=UPI002618AB42|nr:phage tail tape measure protein [Christiangramia sp.]
MAAEIKVPTVFTARDKFSAVMKQMTSGVSRFAKNSGADIDRFDHKVSRSFRKLGSLGALALGLTLGTMFTNAFNDVTDYETGLVGVSKTTGIVGKDLDTLSDDILDLSKEMRGISASSLTDVAQAAGQLGVTGSKNILIFSETMAKLEKSSDIAGEEGAASIARLLNITGEGVGVIDQFGASIVGLGNSSAATESEILSVASEVGRATAAYKLQAKEILGISTTLKSLDVRPEAAGTAVGKVFRGIEMATIQGGKTLRNYGKVMGMTSSEVQKAFAEDPQKAFTMFIKGLNRISNEGGSVAKALSDVGLSGETVSKGIVPLATNFDLLNDKLKQSSDEWNKNTALNKEFDAASKTVKTGLADIKDEFTNVILKQATAGSGLDYLQKTLFFVADNMDMVVVSGVALVGMYVALKAIVWGTKIATAAYNVVLGINTAITQKNKRALIGNTVAQGAYKVAMAAGAAWTWIATAATTAFGVAMNLSLWPILAIVAGIVGLILIIKNWSTITDWFGKKWEQFTKWISKLWGGVTDFFSEFDFKAFFMDIGQSVLKYLLMPITGLLKLLSMLPGKVGKLASMGLEEIGNITGDLNVNNNGNGVLPSTTQTSSEITRETVQRGRLDVNLNDPGNNVKDVEQSGNFDFPLVTTTQGRR